MSKIPCGHHVYESGCPTCRWRIDITPKGAAYRRLWELPEPAAAPGPCRHLGAEVRRQLCGTCRGKVELKVLACAVHGECTVGKPAPGVAGCCAGLDGRGCKEYAPRPFVQVEATYGGIGDAVLALVAAAGMQAARPEAEVVFACRHERHVPWVALFTGYDRLVHPPLPDVETVRPHERDDITRPLPKGRWLLYGEGAGVAPVLPEARPLPADAVAWAQRFAGCIALSPWSSWQSRTWGLSSWLQVERKLLAEGRRCVVLDDQHRRNAIFRSERVVGESPTRVAAVLRAAALLVSNDSGLAHVAGMLRTPAVVLCGEPRGPLIYGFYPTVWVVEAPQNRLRALAPAEALDVVRLRLEHQRRHP